MHYAVMARQRPTKKIDPADSQQPVTIVIDVACASTGGNGLSMCNHPMRGWHH